MAIPLLLMFIFSYLPMFGIVIAFQDYSIGKPFFGKGVNWVGLKWFREFVQSYYFTRILRNTLVINLLGLFMGKVDAHNRRPLTSPSGAGPDG